MLLGWRAAKLIRPPTMRRIALLIVKLCVRDTRKALTIMFRLVKVVLLRTRIGTIRVRTLRLLWCSRCVCIELIMIGLTTLRREGPKFSVRRIGLFGAMMLESKFTRHPMLFERVGLLGFLRWFLNLVNSARGGPLSAPMSMPRWLWRVTLTMTLWMLVVLV